MRNRNSVAFIVLLMMPLASGCQQYGWITDYSDFGPAEVRARAESRYLFVFYKYWLDDASNRMLSSDVLSDPKVVAMFQDTVNLLVEKEYGSQYEEYMRKYGAVSPPTAVIVAPDGTFSVKKGFIPKDQFIDFAQRSMTRAPTPTAPAEEKIAP